MKNKWRILKIAVTVIIFGYLLTFSLKKFNNSPVDKIDVKLYPQENPLYFIGEEDVSDIVKKMNPTLRIGDLDIPKIERDINEIDVVDSANVYLNLNGVLNVDIVQRVPKFRLNNNSKSCYVDKKGKEFSISDKYSHPCLLVSGNILPEEYLSIIKCINTLERDAFFKNYFIGIEKVRNNYYLLTSDGEFKVELGDLENLDFKMKGFKVFVEKYLVFQEKNKYNKVSLKYDNQIVATLNKQ